MIPCILSGGSGTRLWPISRESHPKQFAEIFEESLIFKTARRLMPLGSPWVITTRSMRILTERLFDELGLPKDQILLEPLPRNTAAAIALICWKLKTQNRAHEVVGIFPADHFVEKRETFQRALRMAEAKAAEGAIVTLGVQPTYPSTGYGYIELESQFQQSDEPQDMRALGFSEKPVKSKAVEYLNSGRFAWNAGIFVFRADRMIELLKQHLSDTWDALDQMRQESELAQVYPQLRSISVDYAIMEKLPSHTCIVGDFGWNDVGSWDEVAAMHSGTQRPLVQVASKNCFVFSQESMRSYALVGVEDLLVIDSADALLVCKKGESQKVKEAQQALFERNVPAAREHLFDIRPWGRFEVLRDSPDFKSKVIRVEPGHQLSYQSHAQRAEHWVIISGHPEVVLNDEILKPQPGEHIFIPAGAKHRIRNRGRDPVEFVEVQVGTYFGEDDIVRYEDDYQRV